MTIVFEAVPLPAPAVHVLAIGVGRYPHLVGGDQTTAANPLGLKQLTSPPVSAKAVIDWFLAPSLTAGATGFCNPVTPLGSVEGLVSAAAPVTIATLNGPVALEAATRESIQAAFGRWLKRVQQNEANIGVFYFCGHGIMVASHYLLAEDFGVDPDQPWAKAFDISTTCQAVEREVKGTVYYFIDACREVARDVALTLGANPTALKALNLQKPVVRTATVVIEATGEGKLAFATNNEKSRFTTALLTAMSGYCGVAMAGKKSWIVDGEVLSSAVRALLDKENKVSTSKQVSGQKTEGSSMPLLRLGKPPLVQVELDLNPSSFRAIARMYLLSAAGKEVFQDKIDNVFRIEVPRGMYCVGAQASKEEFKPVQLEGEDLTPPVYIFTMDASP